MAAADRNFEVTQVPENTSLSLLYFIRCRGRFQREDEIAVVPTWVWDCAKPYDGPIPADRPIWDVDVSAEMAERAAMVTPVVDLRRFTNAETMEYLNWSEADYVLARDCYGFPKNDAFREDAGVIIGGGTGEPCRLKSAIDAWVAESRTKITTLTRLLGDDKPSAARGGFFSKKR